METTEAGFVTMLMDRLQALEQHNQSLSEQVQALQKRSEEHDHRLLCTLHVPLGHARFSDGCSIEWELGQPPRMITTAAVGAEACTGVPLDEAHDQATMFHGLVFVKISDGYESQSIIFSKFADQDHRTSFGEFWRAVNQWINSSEENSLVNLAKGCMYNGLDWTHTKPEFLRMIYYKYA